MGCVQWGLQLGQSSNLFVEGIQTWSRIYSADSFYMCTLVKLWSRKCGFKAWGVFSFLFGLTRVITLHLTFYVCAEYTSEFFFCFNLQGHLSGKGKRAKSKCALWLCRCSSFSFIAVISFVVVLHVFTLSFHMV